MWKSLRFVQIFVIPWTIESMEFSRPEYWSGWLFPSPRDLPNPGIKSRSPTFQADSLPAEPWGMHNIYLYMYNMYVWVFPGCSRVKNTPANAGDTHSIPGLTRSPGVGSGNQLQYSCLGNSVPDVQAQSRKGRGTRDQIANIYWIMEKASEFQKSFCFIDYAKASDCVDDNKLWKILKEMGILDQLTCLLRNLYAGQEAS